MPVLDGTRPPIPKDLAIGRLQITTYTDRVPAVGWLRLVTRIFECERVFVFVILVIIPGLVLRRSRRPSDRFAARGVDNRDRLRKRFDIHLASEAHSVAPVGVALT